MNANEVVRIKSGKVPVDALLFFVVVVVVVVIVGALVQFVDANVVS